MSDVISRKRMEEVIRSGGSVLLPGGKIATKISELPAESELAKGDRNRSNAAREAILAQRRALDEELAELDRETGGASPSNSGASTDSGAADSGAGDEASAGGGDQDASEETDADASGTEADGDSLPKGFPGKSKLKAAGFTLRSQVRELGDEELGEIGLKPEEIGKIRAALAQ